MPINLAESLKKSERAHIRTQPTGRYRIFCARKRNTFSSVLAASEQARETLKTQ